MRLGISTYLSSGIRDNHTHGRVGDFLREKIKESSNLSIVSAYLTIYAYKSLKKELNEIDCLRFMFGEPRLVKSLDPDKTGKKSYKIENEGLFFVQSIVSVQGGCGMFVVDPNQ